MKALNKARVVVTADRLSVAKAVSDALNEAGVTVHAIPMNVHEFDREKRMTLKPDLMIDVRDRSKITG